MGRRLMRMRIGVYECLAAGIGIAARVGLIVVTVALRRRSATLTGGGEHLLIGNLYLC